MTGQIRQESRAWSTIFKAGALGSGIADDREGPQVLSAEAFRTDLAVVEADSAQKGIS